jgi:NADPH:quinone reductase-like Zn-dependent oxidoreductase
MSEPKMSAVLMKAREGADQLIYEQMPRPQPREGEVLIRVCATAITPTEFAWISASRSLPTILGHELSGIVASVGPGTSGMAVGTAVYGLTDFGRDGAEAEYTIAYDGELAPEGLLVSIVSPPSPVQAAVHGVRAEYFIVEPNRNQLTRIAEMIDAGVLHPMVDSVYPLAHAREAYRHAQAGKLRGKVVLRVGNESGTGAGYE